MSNVLQYCKLWLMNGPNISNFKVSCPRSSLSSQFSITFSCLTIFISCHIFAFPILICTDICRLVLCVRWLRNKYHTSKCFAIVGGEKGQRGCKYLKEPSRIPSFPFAHSDQNDLRTCGTLTYIQVSVCL